MNTSSRRQISPSWGERRRSSDYGRNGNNYYNNINTFGEIPPRETNPRLNYNYSNNNYNQVFYNSPVFINNVDINKQDRDLEMEFEEFKAIRFMRIKRIVDELKEMTVEKMREETKKVTKEEDMESIEEKSIFQCIDYMSDIRMENMKNSNYSSTELLTKFRKMVVEDFTNYNKFRELRNLVRTPIQDVNLPPTPQIPPHLLSQSPPQQFQNSDFPSPPQTHPQQPQTFNLSGGANSNNTIPGINNFNNIEGNNSIREVFQKFHLTEESIDNLININPLLLTEDDYSYIEITEEENSNIIKDYFLPDMSLEDFKNIFYGLYIQKPIRIKDQYVRVYINEIYLTNKDFPLFFFINLPDTGPEENGTFENKLHLVHYNKYGDNDEDIEEKDEDYLYLINKEEEENNFIICEPVSVNLNIEYITPRIYEINTKNFYNLEEISELNNVILSEEDRKYNFEIHRNNTNTNDLIEKICNKYVYGLIYDSDVVGHEIYGYYNTANYDYMEETKFYILRIKPKEEDEYSDDNYWCLFYHRNDMFFPIFTINKLYDDYDKRIPLVGLIYNIHNSLLQLLYINEEEAQEIEDIGRILNELRGDREKLINNFYLKIDYNIKITNNFPHIERLELLENITVDNINNLICRNDYNIGTVPYEGDIQIITGLGNQTTTKIFKNTLNNMDLSTNSPFCPNTYLFLDIETYLSLYNRSFQWQEIQTKIITCYKGFWIYIEVILGIQSAGGIGEDYEFQYEIKDIIQDTIFFCPFNSNYEKHNLVDGEWFKYNNRAVVDSIYVKFIKSINDNEYFLGNNQPIINPQHSYSNPIITQQNVYSYSVNIPRKSFLFLTKDNFNPDLTEREDKITREEDLTIPHYVKTYIDRTLNYLNMENYKDIMNIFNLDRFVLECINKPIGLIEFKGGMGMDYGGLRADYISFVSSSFKNTFFEEFSFKLHRDEHIYGKKLKLSNLRGGKRKLRTKNKNKNNKIRTKKIRGGANRRFQRLIEKSKIEENMRRKQRQQNQQNQQNKENTNSSQYSAGLDYSKISITNINVLLKRNKDNKLSKNEDKTIRDQNLKYMYMIGGLTLAKLLAVDNGDFMNKNVIMDIPFSSYLGNRLTNEYLSNWIDIYAIFKKDTEDTEGNDIDMVKYMIEEEYDYNNSDFDSLIDLENIDPEYLQFFFTEKELKKKVSDLVLPEQYNLAYTFLYLLDKYERYLHKENYFFTKGFKAFFGKSVNEKLFFSNQHTKSLITEGDFMKATYIGMIDKDKLLSLITYQKIHSIPEEKKEEYTNIIIEIINELDNEQLKKLLFFWTGSTTLNNTNHIIEFTNSDYIKIITSHTCNNQLDLYIKKDEDTYYTKEELKKGIIASYGQLEHGFA